MNNFKNHEINYYNFSKLCIEEKLIDFNNYSSNYKPQISVILPSFNKENVLMKSIRSIQNQSFKNIEIIIVDDCSTDNSKVYYKYLLETDQRIRIFYHLKNMGVWRTRIDGLLYSRGKYVIFFDTGDLYSDNYVLEDSFNLVEKFNLDSVKMLFRPINNYNTIEFLNCFNFPEKENYNRIVYEKENIQSYSNKIFKNWLCIWNRLTRSDIYIEGLYLLNSTILNIYKNLWEDVWWNNLIDEVSNNLMIIKRYGYLYFFDNKGEGTPKPYTISNKDNLIHEFIYFLYFELNFLPKENNKEIIINKLRKYNNKTEIINLNCFISKFYILDNLLINLLNDFYVTSKDKNFLKKLSIIFFFYYFKIKKIIFLIIKF